MRNDAVRTACNTNRCKRSESRFLVVNHLVLEKTTMSCRKVNIFCRKAPNVQGFKVQLLSIQVVLETIGIDLAGAVVLEVLVGTNFFSICVPRCIFFVTLGAKSRDDLHQTKYPFAYDGWGFPQGGAERFLVQWTVVFDF